MGLGTREGKHLKKEIISTIYNPMTLIIAFTSVHQNLPLSIQGHKKARKEHFAPFLSVFQSILGRKKDIFGKSGIFNQP